jgi:hypothetical protein
MTPRTAARLLHSGPAGAAELAEQLSTAVTEISRWMAEYGTFNPHPSQDVEVDALERATAELRTRLRDNYPFFHPRYVGSGGPGHFSPGLPQIPA